MRRGGNQLHDPGCFLDEGLLNKYFSAPERYVQPEIKNLRNRVLKPDFQALNRLGTAKKLPELLKFKA
jgi:hypothetical protein